MGTVATAIHGISIGLWVVTNVIVTNEVPAVLDTAVLAVTGEASLLGARGSESRMLVVNTGVNDTDLDALSGKLVLLVDNVDTSHGVERAKLSIGGLLLSLLDLGNTVLGNGPDVLDTGESSNVLTIVSRLDVNGSSVEDVVLVADLVVDLAGVQGVLGIIVGDAIMVLDNVTIRNDVGVLDLAHIMEGSSRDQGRGSESGEDSSDFHGRNAVLVMMG